MKIEILCSDLAHPVIVSLKAWAEVMAESAHDVSIYSEKKALSGGDILFLVSCSEFIGLKDRQKFKGTFVLHASDLPQGRGWSPHIWSILHGSDQITVSLIAAEDQIDSGDIWLQSQFKLEGHELLAEINEQLFAAEISLMTELVNNFNEIVPRKQVGDPGEYMQKRSPADSKLDPDKTIAEQFEILRVADFNRYPAFFDYRGKRYLIKLEKDSND